MFHHRWMTLHPVPSLRAISHTTVNQMSQLPLRSVPEQRRHHLLWNPLFFLRQSPVEERSIGKQFLGESGEFVRTEALTEQGTQQVTCVERTT